MNWLGLELAVPLPLHVWLRQVRFQFIDPLTPKNVLEDTDGCVSSRLLTAHSISAPLTTVTSLYADVCYDVITTFKG